MVSEPKMREILFRGKRTKTGKWVEGLLFHHCEKSSSIWSAELDRAVWVAPETVGQFTGLTDKNGKRIFEGDIVEINHNAYPGVKGEVFFKNGSFMLKNVSDVLTLYGFLPWCEVVGNIRDNPELLEGL
jgi:uncharacterized phage protein (TIGR01671 family)